MRKIVFLCILLFFTCSKDDSTIDPLCCVNESLTYVPSTSLKSLANFPIGNIVSANKILNNNQFKSVLLSDFNSITAENDMKMANIFIGPNSYDFTDGDIIVDFAQQNGLRVFGHTLIWHSSIPNWLQNYSGTDEEFEQLIEDYIKSTVSHFSQQKMVINGEEVSVVAAWDVVNEAFTSQAESSIFRQRLGDDYLEKCFTWAREADQDVKLFYNDYKIESIPAKLNQVLSLIDDFRSNNIPIDGIGLQMHIDHIDPNLVQIKNHLDQIIEKDILIHFSELDITVNRTIDISELTYERALSQENRYRNVVETYRRVPLENRFGITLWGMRDVDSWLLNHHNNPLEYPLLFDVGYNAKIAHRGFAEGLIE